MRLDEVEKAKEELIAMVLEFRNIYTKFLFGRLGKFGQFIFKCADVIKMNLDVLDYILRCAFSVAFMHDKFTDKIR